MKKITIATVLAGVVLSGFCIEGSKNIDSNIVGFSNSELGKDSEGKMGGFKMISPSFMALNKNGYWLSQLTPKNYENNEDLIYGEGTGGEFNIQMLSDKGKVIGTYSWVRSNPGMEPDTWENDGHWVAPGPKPIVTGDENDLLVKPGQGLYFKAPGNAGDEGTFYPLTMAGQVNQADVPIKFLDDGGFQCLGNPYPVSIWLSSLIPTGYENNEDLIYGEGTGGEFNIQMLSDKGKVIGTYSWVRSNPGMEPDTWENDGHWVAPGPKPIVYNSETKKFDNDLEITPGMGVYFKTPGHMGDEGNDYTMQINYPIEKSIEK